MIIKRLFIQIVLLVSWLTAVSQPLCHVVRYDESDGVPSSHVTQLLQDDEGFMWFATWNGLCRYDGYEFQTFKPQVGDGCHMKSDRLRNITLLPSNQILCRVDEEDYLFDLQNYRFRDLTEKEKCQYKEQKINNRQSRSLQNRDGFSWTDSYQTTWTLRRDGNLTWQQEGQDVSYPLPLTFHSLSFAMKDQRGNLWALDYGSIYKFCTDRQRTNRLDITPKSEVKCLFNDSQGRYWVATKDDETVRVYRRSDDYFLGFLGKDGRLYQHYTSFGAAVYCMYESADGTLWAGTKPQGIFRLRSVGNHAFSVEHFNDLPGSDVYHMISDRFGRLWIASLDGGVYYATNLQDDQPRFSSPKQYPREVCRRARYMYINNKGILLIATSSGLLISELLTNADEMVFRLHQRDSGRKESLSCSATMDVVEDSKGGILISTESGGINMIENKDLMDSIISFHHARDEFHVQSNDVVLSLTPLNDNKIMAVGSHLITILEESSPNRVLDARNFGSEYRFSEAHPIALSNGRWLFGLTDGAFIMTENQMFRETSSPKIVFTKLTIQNDSVKWMVNQMDTLLLDSRHRSITVHFAALDYIAPEHIKYAFRLLPNEQWNYIGENRSATLIDLQPGTYQLEVRSTNTDGQWLENQRTITIIVEPTFWESAWGQIFIQLLIIAILGAVIYTLLYIRRIKRQQHETLKKYLALIETRDKEQLERAKAISQEPSLVPTAQISESQELDPMLQRIMQFVEENISNGDASVGDMAAFAATSRSGLQRKLKQTMGITPQDLLREARIKHASQLLRQTDKTVSEIAYACGFTDPKYFSRCFKQSTGQSPSEYKS